MPKNINCIHVKHSSLCMKKKRFLWIFPQNCVEYYNTECDIANRFFDPLRDTSVKCVNKISKAYKDIK